MGRVIAIVGCHRSGTSMVTHLLSRYGFSLGDETNILVEVDAENAKGYWENREVQQINEELLALSGGAWFDVHEFPAGWAELPEYASLLKRAKNLLQKESGSFIFKDPRTSVLLPFWLKVAPDIRLVHVLRHPPDVARSLEDRQFSIDRERGLLLWAIYSYKIIRDGRYNMAHITWHENYFHNPDDELNSLIDALEEECDGEKIAAVTTEVVSPDLRSDSELWQLEGGPAHEIAMELYDKLEWLYRRQFTQDKKGLAADYEKIFQEMVTSRLEERIENAWQSTTNDRPVENSMVIVQKAETPGNVSASIIIVNYMVANLIEDLVRSLYTDPDRPSFEIIVIDNSYNLDEKNQLIEIVRDHPEITLAFNRNNVGFATANNQGLDMAQGEYIVFLNPDTHVTAGWFSAMKGVLDEHPDIGLLNPLTNRVGHYGALSIIDGDSIEEVCAAASPICGALQGEWLELPSLGFFCAMGRRDVVDKVGRLDELYCVGGYEDDDFCRRTMEMGYRLALCMGSFVYHHHDRSFSLLPLAKRRAIAERNKELYENKWGSYENQLELNTFFAVMEAAMEKLGGSDSNGVSAYIQVLNSILKNAKSELSRQYIKRNMCEGEVEGLRIKEKESMDLVNSLEKTIDSMNKKAEQLIGKTVQQKMQQWENSLPGIQETLHSMISSKSFKLMMLLRFMNAEVLSFNPKRIYAFCKAVFLYALGKGGTFNKYYFIDPVYTTLDNLNAMISAFSNSNTAQITISATEFDEDDKLAQSKKPQNIIPGKRSRTGARRVAYFTNQLLDVETGVLRYGGGERYCMTLTSLLKELGFEVDIYQFGHNTFTGDYHGNSVHAIPFGKKSYSEFNIGAVQKFYEISQDYDHVIYNLPEISAGRMREDAINICHGIWFDHNNYGLHTAFRTPKWYGYLKKAFENPRLCVSVDTNSVNVIRSLWPELALKMRYIPNFVDSEIFYPPEKPRENKPLKVIFPRRSQVNRGSRILEAILTAVTGDVRFYWIGEGDAQDTHIIKKLAEKDPRLSYHSASFDEMPGWYRKADICVIPTIACEGTSFSLLESLASGCATVSTNVGGLPDIMQNGLNGLLVDPLPESIAEAINKYIENRGLREHLQQEGVKSAHYFSLSRWKEQWTDLLKSIKWI